MTDVQDKILGKYGIDILQDNIFKLYKIESVDLDNQALQEKFDAARKRWSQSINGPNERNAERDRLRLEKADKYEEILKDTQIRKKLFNYYNDSSKKGKTSNLVGDIEFAREYFQLISTTKKINKQDVEFYFKYYKFERKNKKHIIEMLKKEFKVIILGKGKEHEESDKDDPAGKKKKESSPLIINLFQEATIIRLGKCVKLFEVAQESTELCQRYPLLRENIYDFIGMKQINNVQQFSDSVSEFAKEVYAIRQERGTEYIPLVDLFNTLKSISDYRDVVDNFEEFKLLIKYPNLTPYMYALLEVKPSTIKQMIIIANRDYAFRNETDFILNYFIIVHDNFGISNRAIEALIKKNQKKAKSNKVFNELDEKIGRKKKKKISIGAEIIHWAVYFPVFVLCFIFELLKMIFTKIHILAWPIFATLLLVGNWKVPTLVEIDNLLVLGKIFSKPEWHGIIDYYFGVSPGNMLEGILLSIIIIIMLLMVYVLPPLLAVSFVKDMAENFNKQFDWVGLERTFKNLFQNLRTKTENQYNKQKSFFFKDKTFKILINIICLFLVLLLIYFIPIGFNAFKESSGYFQEKETVVQEYSEDISQDDLVEEVSYVTMIITVGYANIRAGIGTNHDIVKVSPEGTTFLATGEQDLAENGSTWYEIYLDEEKTQTGWASEKVIAIQE